MKTSGKTPKKPKPETDLAAHYDLDYTKARPNRFARLKKGQNYDNRLIALRQVLLKMGL